MTPEEMRERIDRATAETAEVLADGLQPHDIAILVRNGAELADAYEELDGSEKKAFAVAYATELLTEHLTSDNPNLVACIKKLDLPGPEFIEAAVWDPLLIKVVPDLLRPIIIDALPGLFDLVVGATRGELKVNRKES